MNLLIIFDFDNLTAFVDRIQTLFTFFVKTKSKKEILLFSTFKFHRFPSSVVLINKAKREACLQLENGKEFDSSDVSKFKRFR